MAKVNPAPGDPGEGTIWFDYFVINDPSGHEGVPPKKIPKGAIAGGVIGGVIFLACVILSVILLLRRRERRKKERIQEEHQRFREFGYPGYDKGRPEDRDLAEARGAGRPSCKFLCYFEPLPLIGLALFIFIVYWRSKRKAD